MSLRAHVAAVNGRPILHLNGEPTTEFWCYGQPVTIEDFAAAQHRICQFHVPSPSWWQGEGKYDFAPTDAVIAEFERLHPDVLLIPRVNFGYRGERWYAEQNPSELSVARNLAGDDVDYESVKVRPVENWHSAGSEKWTQDAAAAMADFVKHFETNHADRVIGYQIGCGISAEWFRWWNFVDDVYEDYSPVAQAAFRKFLLTRYGDDAKLKQAWGRDDVTIGSAEVPPPPRQHTPTHGYFRDPVAERDVIDWLDCLSDGNAGQIIALCEAAKQACDGNKLVGTFYGYVWPHWNTQNPSRSGHVAIEKVLASPAIDYISAPYHYDNRGFGGFHHGETVAQTIERAGKLHLDEIDSATHDTRTDQWPYEFQGRPANAKQSCAVLRRDAATILGTAGLGWWMDLRDDRWFRDEAIQAELRDMQALARQAREWPVEPQAEVALVIDDRSNLYTDLVSDYSQLFTAMPRQFEWSDQGFPIDTIMLREIGDVKPYKLYVFLNCWHVDAQQREQIFARVRHSGGTALWFYGCGYYDGQRAGVDAVSDLVGMKLYAQSESAVLEVNLRDSGDPLIEQSLVSPRGAMQFGARLAKDRIKRLVTENPRGWEPQIAPVFEVEDGQATILGRYVHDGSAALAVVDRDGWRSVYCGAPMLPGWVLRRLAADAGAHIYTSANAQVFHRGPLLSVYHPTGGDIRLTAPVGQRLTLLACRGDKERRWRPDADVAADVDLELRFAPGETKFFLTDR